VDFISVAASAPDGSDAANNLFGLVRALCDAKTLACGGAYKSFSAAHPNDRETFPVEKRAVKVPKQYLAAARDLDQKFHNSQRDVTREPLAQPACSEEKRRSSEWRRIADFTRHQCPCAVRLLTFFAYGEYKLD
jgi:hypothetical protein